MKKENSKTIVEKFQYKGLDCAMKTVTYEPTKAQPKERYSHVAMCDDLDIRTKSHDTHTAAMQELKKLIDESMKDKRNNSLVDKRGSYKGIPYAILYQAPRGYFARVLDKSFPKIVAHRYFDTVEQAEEHLEMEIGGYMEMNQDKSKKKNSLEAKKLAIIKSNATPVKSPSANKVASGDYRGGNWYMWKDGEKFVVQLIIELGKSKERQYMAEAGSTQEEALSKVKQRADRVIADWNKKWPNDMYKNSLETKKLAIIKSNAAPEVKLKAIEKLDLVKNNAQNEVSAAVRGEVRALCNDLIQDAKHVVDYCSQLKSMSASSNIGWDEADYIKIVKQLKEAKKKASSTVAALKGR